MNPDIPAFHLGMLDAHVHSKYSCDSGMEPADAVRAARANDLAALVFTEHADFDPCDESYGFYDAEAVSVALSCLTGHNTQLKIYRGIEIGYQQQYEQTIRDFIADGRFDWVIGSVHMVGSDDLSRPESQEQYYRLHTQREAYGAYFAEVEKLVASGLFDCLGHLDLCKRYGHKYYGPMAWRDFGPQIASILRSAIRQGMFIELNTSGLRHAPQEPYPSFEVVREYTALGGTKLVLGSDAHSPEHVGHAFADICDKLNVAYRIQNTSVR